LKVLIVVQNGILLFILKFLLWYLLIWHKVGICHTRVNPFVYHIALVLVEVALSNILFILNWRASFLYCLLEWYICQIIFLIVRNVLDFVKQTFNLQFIIERRVIKFSLLIGIFLHKLILKVTDNFVNLCLRWGIFLIGRI
jgi:hypothetical protein